MRSTPWSTFRSGPLLSNEMPGTQTMQLARRSFVTFFFFFALSQQHEGSNCQTGGITLMNVLANESFYLWETLQQLSVISSSSIIKAAKPRVSLIVCR